MTSKAQRRRRKVGRPRLIGVTRRGGVAGGKPEPTADEIRSVAVAARIRHGLAGDKKQATDPRSGYALGRHWQRGEICSHMHDAGLRFSVDWRRHLIALGAPRPWPKCMGDAGPTPREIDAETSNRWRAQFASALGAARAVSNQAYTALCKAAINDDDVKSLGLLRPVLRAMVEFYGIDCDGEDCGKDKKVNAK